MKQILDRIKQGLRNIRRLPGDYLPRRAAHCDKEAVPAQRMRTELDAADVRKKPPVPTQPLAQAHQPTSVRLRKATLSKARRVGPPQNAPSLWGIATPTGDGPFGMPAEPPPLLSGATLVGLQAIDGERAQRPRTAGGFLDGAPSFGRPAEPTNQGDALFGPAPNLTPGEEPKDRLF